MYISRHISVTLNSQLDLSQGQPGHLLEKDLTLKTIVINSL